MIQTFLYIFVASAIAQVSLTARQEEELKISSAQLVAALRDEGFANYECTYKFWHYAEGFGLRQRSFVESASTSTIARSEHEAKSLCLSEIQAKMNPDGQSILLGNRTYLLPIREKRFLTEISVRKL